MSDLNIIGDIAGEFKTLKALVNKMPDCPVLSVGDLVDRGPHSDIVVKYFMETPEFYALKGNHEDMMVNAIKDPRFGDTQMWLKNGGAITVHSYCPTAKYMDDVEIPKAIIDWMEALPIYYETDEFIASHAPIPCTISGDRIFLEEGESEGTFIWNRAEPLKLDKFQIFGHNAKWGLRWFEDWAVCIDSSWQKVLTGIHMPSRRIYQQEFIK